jgi:hypothetical protein
LYSTICSDVRTTLFVISTNSTYLSSGLNCNGRVAGLEEGQFVVEADFGWRKEADLDLSGFVAVEDRGSVALETKVEVEEGRPEQGEVPELLQGHWLLHQLPGGVHGEELKDELVGVR